MLPMNIRSYAISNQQFSILSPMRPWLWILFHTSILWCIWSRDDKDSWS